MLLSRWNVPSIISVIQSGMASTEYLQPSVRASASEVARLVALEMSELHSRYREVTMRIRKLRIAMGALQELDTANNKQPEILVEGGTLDNETNKSCPSKQTEGRRPDSMSGVQTVRRSRTQSSDLARACRIALMEAVDPVSEGDVYSRILRRGSYCFGSPTFAMLHIAKELNAMVEDGDLDLVGDSSKPLWQRSHLKRDAHDAIPE